MKNKSANTIENKLAEIRKRRRRVWILLLTFIPACFIGGIIAGTEASYLIIAVLWTLLSAYFVGRAFTSRCPNCGNYFYIKGMFNNPLSQKCLHCKISLRYKAQKQDDSS